MNKSRNEGTAIVAKMMTGTMVQRTSSTVLCVVRVGVGFARALKRTMMIKSRIKNEARNSRR